MTPHIEAKQGDYADTVLLPGDPLRAKWIAETFFDNPVQVNGVRNCLGYTGTYNGKRISVQAGGMGMPSNAIYITELFKFYNVEKIIRVGSCGGIAKHVKVGDIVLFDVAAGIAKGKALDIAQSSSVDGFNVKFLGTDNYKDIKNSDVIIITAGVPRKPGMSRDDLLGINLKIMKQVAEGIKSNCPDAFVICITNPLDVMVMAFQSYSNLPKNKVVGMAGILDSSRYKLFLSEELNVPVKQIDALVMGGHGDTMVPLPGFTKINGKKLLDLIEDGKVSKERIEEINQRTRDGGAEIVKYLEKGSAYYAPAASGVEMAICLLYTSDAADE